MSRSSGIELGPDSCVLVAASPGRDGTDVSAFHVIDAEAWPSHDTAVTATLRAARRRHRFPRHAAVVLWGLPDTASPLEPSTRAAVRPILDAGFRVDSILTPPQALAALAATRPRPAGDEAVAWLALNRHGAAIAIVRGTELLFARTLDWLYRPSLTESRAQLLQRYSLVAALAPEIQRGIAAVRASHGVRVSTAVTCGDLPELRSLTMPLIEELNLEVETLDSTEGVRAVGRADAARFGEVAPALRVAAAAAVAPGPQRAWRPGVALRAAAAAAAILLLAWVAWRLLPGAVEGPAPSAPPSAASPPAQRGAGRPGQESARVPALALPERPASGGPDPPPAQSPVATQGAAEAPSSTPTGAGPPGPARRAVEPAGASRPPAPPAPSAAERRRAEALPPVSPLPSRREPAAPPAAVAEPSVPRPIQSAVPLKDPLPKLDSILIDHKRRLAIIDGSIVKVGDAIGARVVVRIEPEAVVFREPSGLLVTVRLRHPDGGEGQEGTRGPAQP